MFERVGGWGRQKKTGGKPGEQQKNGFLGVRGQVAIGPPFMKGLCALCATPARVRITGGDGPGACLERGCPAVALGEGM